MSLKVLTTITYLIALVHAFYYTFNAPHEGKGPHHTIWGQNSAHHTPFSMNSIITSIYWIVLFVLQIGYSWHLYSSEAETVHAAANVGGHFIVHNLFFFAFIQLWVRSFFWLAEFLLVLNFFNLSFAYFRHSTTPRAIHIAVVSGPLAWNFVALYWVGAAAVHAHNLPARIVANIFIWGILVYGGFFLVVYKDYTIGFELSVLAAGEYFPGSPRLVKRVMFANSKQQLAFPSSSPRSLHSSGSSPSSSWPSCSCFLSLLVCLVCLARIPSSVARSSVRIARGRRCWRMTKVIQSSVCSNLTIIGQYDDTKSLMMGRPCGARKEKPDGERKVWAGCGHFPCH